MDIEEKMCLIAELLEEEVTVISPTTELSAMDYWDSMAALSLIVLLEENFGRTDITTYFRRYGENLIE
jgi:acyl carrier protein